MGIPAPRSVHTKCQFTLVVLLMEGSCACTAGVHIAMRVWAPSLSTPDTQRARLYPSDGSRMPLYLLFLY